jgi:isopenicillin-N N-acyltransferase like protein
MATFENRSGVPVLTLTEAAGQARGEAHGTLLKSQIEAVYQIRLELMLEKTDLETEAQVLKLAHPHLAVLKDFDLELYDELLGIAKGSGLSPEQLIVVNHYTDLRDLGQRTLEDLPQQDPGGCSVLFKTTPQGPVLGQTWDMHGSAQDYVIVIELPDMILFSIAGCLGMTGLNRHGVGMTINNLNSLDATVGIVWPALVRGALRSLTADEARDTVMSARIGSGHHYVVADANAVYGIETSGTKKKIIQEGTDQIHLHTNHCLDEEMQQTARVPEGSTSMRRMAGLEGWMAQGGPDDALSFYHGLSCVEMPRKMGTHDSATCGALVMDLSRGQALACVGIPSAQAPVMFKL